MAKTTRTKATNVRQLAKAAETINKARTDIVLTGRVKNGKVQLDQSCLNEIARKFGKANKAFVAVNAPFDPVSR